MRKRGSWTPPTAVRRNSGGARSCPRDRRQSCRSGATRPGPNLLTSRILRYRSCGLSRARLFTPGTLMPVISSSMATNSAVGSNDSRATKASSRLSFVTSMLTRAANDPARRVQEQKRRTRLGQGCAVVSCDVCSRSRRQLDCPLLAESVGTPRLNAVGPSSVVGACMPGPFQQPLDVPRRKRYQQSQEYGRG